MKDFENIYQLHQLLKTARHPVPFDRIHRELHCTPKAAEQLLRELRDTLGAPLQACQDPVGYRYGDPSYELPGLWFSANEVQALLLLQQLLQTFQPGLLDDALAPLRERLEAILEAQGISAKQGQRLRLLRVAARPASPHFGVVAAAVLQRQKLNIHYTARSTGKRSERDISPQRLTHYRDNWYLDAWCHRQNGLRTFSLDCVDAASLVSEPAKIVEDTALDAELSSAYGIFSGAPTAVARLKFTAERARWVASEQWHEQQTGRMLSTGEYLLNIPYHHSEELILDILRYGPDVEVLAPPDLRKAVAQRLEAALARYR